MKNRYITAALFITIAILLIMVCSFVGDVRRLHRNSVFVYPSLIRRFFHVQQKPAPLSNVNLIWEWMTFGYINKSFNLPSDYLKTKLNISDSTYPNVTISKIAKEQNLATSAYIENVKNAVGAYLGQNKPPK